MTVETPPLKAWVPTLEQIAAYALPYTLEDGVGADKVTGTFSERTTPTADQVRSLRTDAVAWVQASTGSLVGVAQPMGAAVAAMRTAAMIIATTPPGDDALARLLLEAADSALAALVVTNVDAGGTDPTGSSLVPVWSIPPYDERRARYYNGRPLT